MTSSTSNRTTDPGPGRRLTGGLRVAGVVSLVGAGTVVAGALVGALPGPSVAGASPAPAAVVTTATAGGRHQSGHKVPNPTSTSNAGYIATTSGPTTFSVTIKVPVFSCTTGTDPVFIGLFANGSFDDTFTGSGGQVTASCDGPTPTYTAGVFADDGPTSSFTVAAGQKVVFTADADASGESYTVTDAKAHQATSVTGTGLDVQNLQFTTQGGFGDSGGFATFKKIKYGAITVDGGSLAALAPGPLDQVDGSGAIMIKTGKLNGAGNAFGLKFVADA